MKFEHLLKIYWSRGLFYNGKLNKINWTLFELFNNLYGLSNFTKKIFIKRFEYGYYIKNVQKKNIIFDTFSNDKKKLLNMWISQLLSTNHHVKDLIKLNVIRLYLIKSFRGRAQMLGKPSRGQRTWSNAWNAYQCNRTIKLFVNEIIKNNKLIKKPEKKNYKIVKKKLRKQAFKIKLIKIQKKKNLWF